MPATAFAPGSVTTVFVPSTGEEGSLGVSFAIEDGVTTTVAPADSTAIALDGKATAFEPVSRLLEDLSVSATVALESDLPVGRGFGASGAATLGTALAAAEVFDLDVGREGLVDAAHRAELAAGTGQGDVFVQDVGGMVWNTGDGIGRRERTDPVAYSAFEDIATADVLGDEAALSRITAAGTDALADFDPELPLDNWFPVSWAFATETGLVTETVAETIDRVQAAGGTATMAMVGETVIGTGRTDVLEEQTAITPKGARLIE
jgi:pantoate kinase